MLSQLSAVFTASNASPVSSAKPNLESICPVRINSCVCASTPGFILNDTLAFFPSADAIAESILSSSILSKTIQCTSLSSAILSSCSVLLLPWKYTLSIGKPALIAVKSSPPETTSRPSPSCAAIRHISRHIKDLLANSGIPPPL